jgi:N-carbamoyl-L-amino-acid hydrolase
VDVTVERVFDSPAVRFDPDCIDAVRHAAEAFGYPAREIVSGPGHDSCHVARVAPTSMIFVPCEGGLSHNELERTEKEQVTAGANVLLRAVLDTNQRLAERARAG